MATADPGTGPAKLFGVNNKVLDKMKSFREVIDEKISEVRRVGKEMKNLIEKNEKAIIRELNTIFEEVNARLEKKKIEIENEIQDQENDKMDFFREPNSFEKAPTQFDDTIEKIKNEMDIDIPNVKLTWRVDELKDCINRMCRCDQQKLVYTSDTRYQLKWSKCESGRRNNQLDHPWGIAINPMNDNIYVADNGNHRVQIFSGEGEWIRSVKCDEMKHPENVLFHNQSIYIQCSEAILKLNESTEKGEKSKSYDFLLRGICTDNALIYVGQGNETNIIVLTLNLNEVKKLSLKPEFSKQETQIRQIFISKESFYILLSNTEFPIQTFSIGGNLERCVLNKANIRGAYSFFIDQQQNIIVADLVDSMVKIFSNEGELLTQFGEKGSKKGQFVGLFGISLFQHDCIITTDYERGRDKLQLFYPIY